ncbi:hypothetical protein UA08_07327 [Talaromyces atroroseus]|uniref:ABC transporter domain-containing protein n=1 Tax=Talaromyces atroroseus TaxID=1441469 RepID=A0A225AV94_TALAT|nr:hypothetical protein UA08_07327 [Talaromyces atroroseus]OKL57397.1 hypothetical protein UA08_07327 [Talaromyces atroroseus]
MTVIIVYMRPMNRGGTREVTEGADDIVEASTKGRDDKSCACESQVIALRDVLQVEALGRLFDGIDEESEDEHEDFDVVAQDGGCSLPERCQASYSSVRDLLFSHEERECHRQYDADNAHQHNGLVIPSVGQQAVGYSQCDAYNMVGSNGMTLSRGQKQRIVTIYRSLIESSSSAPREDLTAKETFTDCDLWVQWWSDANEVSSNPNLGLYFEVAPLSFFANSSTGAITNRFSQDMRLIDMSLPMAAINTALLQIVMISVSSKYMTVTIPFALGVIYLVHKFYLKTSRQLRLLDLEVKSPLYSNFIETLNGLATIRAFGWTSQLQEQNTRLLDESQKPVYLLYCAQRWLTLVMDMLVACLAIILIILTVVLKESTSGGTIGVALVNIMTFNQGLTNMIKWYMSLETALGIISRVKEFEVETISEERPSSMLRLVDQEWPPSGAIEFRNVSVSYEFVDKYPPMTWEITLIMISNESSYALRDISMSIQAGQKIGICGRTGSGKSSLILSLCQMVDLRCGFISVDGIDLSTLSREAVRSRFNSTTQEPFFIPATMKSSSELIRRSTYGISSRNAADWMDAKLGADKWSLGQQQLFCLARALLKKSQVIILDEVSSSVVSETDKLMQVIIRAEFADSTIFAIAHRLDTILDFDRIAFLDKGSLVEFDSPTRLLERESSAFARLYNGLPDASL